MLHIAFFLGRRHTLLEIRRENPKLFYQYASDPIPLSEKEIKSDLNLMLLLSEYKYDNDVSDDEEDRLRQKRQKELQERINSFLKRVREGQSKISGRKRTKTLHNLVKERSLPAPRVVDIAKLVGTAMEPVRKLKPKVNENDTLCFTEGVPLDNTNSPIFSTHTTLDLFPSSSPSFLSFIYS